MLRFKKYWESWQSGETLVTFNITGCLAIG